MSTNFQKHPSSYRDPSGFIFERDAVLYRQVNQCYRENFELLHQSGLYEKLVQLQLLIPHETINEQLTTDDDYYVTIRPEKIQFISYPWEWSFDMLKDAALLTLRLVKESVAAGMILKDATPFNIQWHKGKLILIDSLSFEKYNANEPWIAYRQFCENFLAPLLLMHHSGFSLHQIQLAWPDGVPLNVAASLLPNKTKFSLHTYLHIHLQAKLSSKAAKKKKQAPAFSKQKLTNLITSLELLIRKLKAPQKPTTWSVYYEEAAQRKNYIEEKSKLIHKWVSAEAEIKSGADLGANEGFFSELLAKQNIEMLAADMDAACINSLYLKIKKEQIKNIQPLILNLANPSPAMGFQNRERESFADRLRVQLLLALALIHHLAIGRNIPFEKMAGWFSSLAPFLIIEFVPKEDEKVQEMLAQKKDIYDQYTQQEFENIFSRHYQILQKEKIGNSGRTLYFMKVNEE